MSESMGGGTFARCPACGRLVIRGQSCCQAVVDSADEQIEYEEAIGYGLARTSRNGGGVTS